MLTLVDQPSSFFLCPTYREVFAGKFLADRRVPASLFRQGQYKQGLPASRDAISSMTPPSRSDLLHQTWSWAHGAGSGVSSNQNLASHNTMDAPPIAMDRSGK